MELIKTEMTPKERLMAYDKGEEVDRIPAVLTLEETGALLYGIQIRDYYSNPELMVAVQSRIATDFGADNMGMAIGSRAVAEALGTELIFPDNSVSHTGKPAITTYDAIDTMPLIDIHTGGRIPVMIEGTKRLIEKFGTERIIGGGTEGPVTLAGFLVGVERFLRDMIRCPEQVQKLLRYSVENVVTACTDVYHETGIKLGFSEPLISKNILSPRFFQLFVVPALRETVARLTEAYGEKPSMHACGIIHDRWDILVDLGFGSLSIDNKEDMGALRNRHGDAIGIVGNVDPVDVMRYGTPEMVTNDVIRCLREAGDNPAGFTLCPGCDLPIGTPKENLIAFMNAAAIYGAGARKGSLPKGLVKAGL